MITPTIAYQDAGWVIGHVLWQDFLDEKNNMVKEERAKTVVLARDFKCSPV